MDKIKKILSPGASKDEEVMYGSSEDRLRASRENPRQEPVFVEGAENKKTGGVLSQITNPDGNKYDEQKFHPVDDSGRKEKAGAGGVLAQITNPDGNKYDERRFDDNSQATPAAAGAVHPNTMLETKPEAEKEHGVLRQILNPGGDKRDEVAFGNTATATEEKSPEEIRQGQSISTGIAGGTAAGTTTGVATAPVGSSTTNTTTTQSLPDRSAQANTNNTGRDAAILGSGAAVGTGAGVAAAKYNEPQDDVLDRSHPLRDGSGNKNGHINPVGAPEASIPPANIVSSYGTSTTGTAPTRSGHDDLSAATYTDRSVPLAGASARTTAAPATTGLDSYNDSSNSGRNTGLVGAAGLAGAGAGAAATRSHDSSELGRSSSANHPPGQNLDCDGSPAQGYVHHTSGPHSTDIANQLDPSVGAGPPLSPTNNAAQTGNNSHLGRDAAVVGGAGAVGAGAYAATRDHNTAAQTGGDGRLGQNTAVPGGAVSGTHPAVRDNTTTATHTGNDSHLGRDAAAVGGAGAVGAGAYAATRDQNTAAHTGGDSRLGQSTAVAGGAVTGTHPATRDNNTTATHSGEDSHLGRDAAVVGGAGAVGAGAYAATRDNTTTAPHGTGVANTSTTTTTHTSTTYGGTNPAIDQQKHSHGTSGGHNTYGGTNPAIDQKHSHATTGAHNTYGGTDPALDRKHDSAAVGAAGVYGGSDTFPDDKNDRKLQHAREATAEKGGDHGEKKPGLIQKILHPRSHGKDEKDIDDKHHSETRDIQASRDVGGRSSEGHEHSHPKTTIDETGRNKLHKDPPPNHPAAQAQAAVAGPDWDAVNKSNT